jgi:hypothetical protein
MKGGKSDNALYTGWEVLEIAIETALRFEHALEACLDTELRTLAYEIASKVMREVKEGDDSKDISK